MSLQSAVGPDEVLTPAVGGATCYLRITYLHRRIKLILPWLSLNIKRNEDLNEGVSDRTPNRAVWGGEEVGEGGRRGRGEGDFPTEVGGGGQRNRQQVQTKRNSSSVWCEWPDKSCVHEPPKDICQHSSGESGVTVVQSQDEWLVLTPTKSTVV